MRLLFRSGSGHHNCEEKEASVFLKAGYMGEVVRWYGRTWIEPLREKSREA